VPKPETVDAYLSAVPGHLGPIAESMHKTISAALPDAEAKLWHAAPTWLLHSNPVCYLKAYGTAVTFGLFRGDAVRDSSGRLLLNGRGMGQVKLTDPSDVDSQLFTDWLHQARQAV
jgi:hypothetical protein